MQTDWKPTGNKILVEMEKVENVTKGGIVLPESKTEREEMSAMVGTIVAAGPMAWADQSVPWAKVGDKVKFAKFAGFLHKENGRNFRVMHDLDIVMVLEGESHE